MLEPGLGCSVLVDGDSVPSKELEAFGIIGKTSFLKCGVKGGKCWAGVRLMLHSEHSVSYSL